MLKKMQNYYYKYHQNIPCYSVYNSPIITSFKVSRILLAKFSVKNYCFMVTEYNELAFIIDLLEELR